MRHWWPVPARYSSDEKGLDWLPNLKALYNTITATDPGHPSWSVHTVGQVSCSVAYGLTDHYVELPPCM